MRLSLISLAFTGANLASVMTLRILYETVSFVGLTDGRNAQPAEPRRNSCHIALTQTRISSNTVYL